MRDEAIFLNGVFEGVLENIFEVQAHLPEQILYLQPYASDRIVRLAEAPPSIDKPVRLLASTTKELNKVHYVAEIVGWDDKRKLKWQKARVLNRIIYVLQPTEDGVYLQAEPGGPDCVNLLHVRRLQKLSEPFSVRELVNANTDQPVSTNRTRAGGWVYVKNPAPEWLQAYLPDKK